MKPVRYEVVEDSWWDDGANEFIYYDVFKHFEDGTSVKLQCSLMGTPHTVEEAYELIFKDMGTTITYSCERSV